MHVRPATPADAAAIWRILEPVFRAGETYAIDRDIDERGALEYWLAPGHDAFVAEDAHGIVGTYYLRANQRGGGSHVANCGYATAAEAQGRGVARAMLEHSLEHARRRGFRAMQFNCVVGTNARAVATWQRYGFEIVGRLPGAFLHPVRGYVDAYVMYRNLA